MSDTREALGAHEMEHAVGRSGRRTGTGRVEVEHRIDNRGMAAFAVVHHVGERGRLPVVEALDLRVHGVTPCALL